LVGVAFLRYGLVTGLAAPHIVLASALVGNRMSPTGPVAGGGCCAAGVAMTVYAFVSYTYFVPQMLSLQSGWTKSETETFVTWWTRLNSGKV
jgi:hypothetical protein